MKHLFYILLTLIFTSIFSQSKWDLKKDKCGIKVWTQKVKKSRIDRYKVQGFIQARPEFIVETLMNFSTFSKWHDGVSSAKTLKRISQSKSMAFMELDFPWPVRNRDSYAYSEIIKELGQTRVTIEQLKQQFKTKNVRVTKSDGYWLVKPKGNGAVVTQELHAEPGGSLPDWIVNSMISKGPYKTMKGLRRFLKAKECY